MKYPFNHALVGLEAKWFRGKTYYSQPEYRTDWLVSKQVVK